MLSQQDLLKLGEIQNKLSTDTSEAHVNHHIKTETDQYF